MQAQTPQNSESSVLTKERRRPKQLAIEIELPTGKAQNELRQALKALEEEKVQLEERAELNQRLRDTYFKYRDYSELVQDEPVSLQRPMTWSERRFCETADITIGEMMQTLREHRDDLEMRQRLKQIQESEIEELYTHYETFDRKKQYLKELRQRKLEVQRECAQLVEKKCTIERAELAQTRNNEMRKLRKLIFAPGELPGEMLDDLRKQTFELMYINEKPMLESLRALRDELKNKIAQMREMVKKNSTQNLFLLNGKTIKQQFREKMDEMKKLHQEKYKSLEQEHEQKIKNMDRLMSEAIAGEDAAEQKLQDLRQQMEKVLEQRNTVSEQLNEQKTAVSQLRERLVFLDKEYKQCPERDDNFEDQEEISTQSSNTPKAKKK